jgi:hypothetical protein
MVTYRKSLARNAGVVPGRFGSCSVFSELLSCLWRSRHGRAGDRVRR